MEIIHVKTIEELDEILSKNNSVVVDFYADWCGPCKMLAPIFKQVSDEVDSTQFVKVNVDEASELANKYGVRSIPTVISFKEGNLSKQNTGFMSKDVLTDFIK
ncbi:thioredoxin [Spiroplasma turonicum]|uniref:Thioredoxin n=1 Tax=Spiroplasma turonicum TaxID=216946 RepID=A0A0K1P621_9MOLU|nr:thioredoxin [Spiroplasma turonicum]AKU79367.1 thioredoxin [Spiroplasma turonicum]ALX70388.1 thioredoxin [Spiroplasma turonicum]